MANPKDYPSALTIEKFEQAKRELLKSELPLRSMLSDRLAADHMGDSLLYGALTGVKGPPITSNAAAGAKSPPPDRFTPQEMSSMICSRMGWRRMPGAITSMPLKEMACVKLNADQAVVFVVHNNQAIVIYDDLNLFPSDTLVTQLRILVG